MSYAGGGVFKQGERERGMSYPEENEPLMSSENSSLQDGMINSGTRAGDSSRSGSKGIG